MVPAMKRATAGRLLLCRLLCIPLATMGVAGCRADAQRFQAASRSAEARSYLNALYMAQTFYRREMGRYSEDFKEIGLEPERGNHYAYFAAEKGAVQLRRAAVLPKMTSFSIVAADEHAHPKRAAPLSLKAAGCPLTLGEDGTARGLGVTGEGADQQFIGYAIGNVDDDPDFDCWSIATFARKTKSGETIPAGQVLHEKSDFER